MKTIRMLAAAAICAATPALAADPAYVGTWGVSVAQCKVPQERQGAPMIVTLKGYDSHETHCAFRAVTKAGDGWKVKSACAVEGDRQAHTFTLRVAGDVLAITEKGRVRSYKRCR